MLEIIGRILQCNCMQAMLATTYAGKLPASYAVEPKFDGVRVLVHCNAVTGQVSFKSRNGKSFTSLRHLKSQVLAFIAGSRGDLTLDCEAVSGTFFDTVGQIRSKKTKALDATLWVFDIIKFGSYEYRRSVLEKMTAQNSVRIVPVAYNADIKDAFRNAKRDGHEGIIIKDTASDYESSERNGAWQKVKDRETYDCKVIAVSSKSLTIDFNGVEVLVGCGFTPSVHHAIFSNPSAMLGRTIEVACQSITPAGSMRHPTFLRVRLDK